MPVPARGRSGKAGKAGKVATLEWVSWFNHPRLLQPTRYIPPAEAEATYWREQSSSIAPGKHAQHAALQEG